MFYNIKTENQGKEECQGYTLLYIYAHTRMVDIREGDFLTTEENVFPDRGESSRK